MKKLSVLGIGRLGLCWSLVLERGGYHVVGADIRADHVDAVNNRELKTIEPQVEAFLDSAANFRATSKLGEAVAHGELLFLTVRTRSMPDGRYDVSQVDIVVEELIALGPQPEPKHLVISCNVNPGCSDEVQERLAGYNYVVSYNPELVAQGTIIADQLRPDFVVIGQGNDEAGEFLREIHHNVSETDPPLHFMSRLSAEITKISLNCFLATKITFANMVGDIATSAGCDPRPILAAIGSDSRIGGKFLRHGFGYGGPCFRRDVMAMVNYSNKQGVEPTCVQAVQTYNEQHLAFQVSDFISRHDRGEPVMFDSVTYKPGVTIIEESQQLLFAAEIARAGFDVLVREDPDVIEEVKGIHGDLFRYEVRR